MNRTHKKGWWMRMRLLAVLVLMVLGGAAFGASQLGEHKITIDAQDADLASIVGAMFKQAGASYSLTDDVRGVVTAHIEDAPLDQALRAILSPRGLVFRKQGDTYLVGKKVEPKLENREDLPPAPRSDEPDPAEEKVVIDKISLNFLDAYDLAAIILGQGGRPFETARDQGLTGIRGTPGPGGQWNPSYGYQPYSGQYNYNTGPYNYNPNGVYGPPAQPWNYRPSYQAYAMRGNYPPVHPAPPVPVR